MDTEQLEFIARQLLKGIGVTLQITLLAALLALALAFIVALLRLSPFRPLSVGARVYIEFFRGTSALVQLFYLFFILPLLGITLSPMTTAVIGLGLNFSSFGAEIVRSALVNVGQGQRDALRALDFPAAAGLRRIILPQALPFMLPPLGSLLVELLKSTSLVSMITLSDLTFSGSTLITSLGHQTLIWSFVLVCYFFLSWPLVWLVRRYERRHTRHRGSRGAR
ncbi:ectoine/hydroxyectoine ABC transporter permease subunit EhuC [Sodalis ligni]|jgi:polar amino acid transport system permease protein|uniref:Amino acid ABC transporter membrane protein 1 (PAAT family) n=2 Tax=Sodalis TaxID=84565 RepID=A0A4R1N8D0_9GAMM|nr:ectoine/hydroxyectoine ABC transporter permease subunit EhuC [Sodalis ligni]QWA13441.1 ectoine/hydroxyectoine ABC transporter permease subunit EhuC [Sodalis ligni]TCL02877.1 amino acid ABC transporter membrane protein 1 (PAAT family) [Sodalis ligni]